MSETLLAVEALEITFFTKQGALQAVDNISYRVPKGKTLGLVGESGCGKSVTSLTIMGLLEPPGKITKGQILLEDQDLAQKSNTEMESIRGNRIAMIFQEPMTSLNPVLTIGFQISEQIIQHLKVSPATAKSQTLEMLHLAGIPSPQKCYHAYPHQLSGGMRQRVMIAMALSCQPDFLIADEPTTALDVTIQAQILELMQTLQDQLQMTIQFITHDLAVISEIADEVIVMYAGKLCEIAETQALFRNPKHPYTHGLIASVPQRHSRAQPLYSIPGNVPSLLHRPSGCCFQDRCPQVTEQCRQTSPPLQNIGRGRQVACYNMM